MKCVLHIGTEKTGTTLLQEWLYANEALLSSVGIALPHTIGEPNNRFLSAYFQSVFDDYYRRNRINTHKEKKQFFKKIIKTFQKEVKFKSESHHTMIITSEQFHSRFILVNDIKHLSKFLYSLFDEVRIICYVREQSAMRSSLYSTALRVGETKDVNEFDAEHDESSDYYNIEKILLKWQQVFGRRALCPVIYAHDRFKQGDIRKDFISKIMDDPPLDLFDYSLISANERLTRLQAAALLAFNRTIPGKNAPPEHLVAGRQRLVDGLLAVPELAWGRLADLRAQEFSARFEASNARLLETYFPGDEGARRALLPGGREMTAESATLTIEEIERLVADLVAGFAGMTKEQLLTDGEVSLLRDLALKYESASAPARQEALTLLRIVNRLRPEGELARRKLAEWQRTEGRGRLLKRLRARLQRLRRAVRGFL